jgi:uncharacterized protein
MQDRSMFYAPTALGRARKITPEGYLLCEGVAIGRLGTQNYSVAELHNPDPNATQYVPDSDGRFTVERLPEEVFDPQSMASFEGKDITVQHPNEFITPDSWSADSVGHMQNIRRGTGAEDDLLVADLLIKDPGAIAYVNRDLPEVSCGYNSEYEQVAPGRLIQRNIIGNHCALVDRGRAGPRCAIKDHLTEENFMAKTKSKSASFIAGILSAFQTKDEAALQAAIKTIDDAPDDDTGGDTTMDAKEAARIKKVCDWVEDRMSKDAAEAEAKKVKDAEDAAAAEAAKKAKELAEGEETGDTILEAEEGPRVLNLGKIYTGDALTEIVANAEILSPGIAKPTKDSLKGTRGKALGVFMRDALNTALTKDAEGEISKSFLMGRKVQDLKGEALVGAFNGAAALVRVRNNAALRLQGVKDIGTKEPVTPKSMNDEAHKFWAGRTSN